MPDINAMVISPSQFTGGGDRNPFPAERYEQRYLAQGDSWFSLGAFPVLWATTNLPAQLRLSRSTLVVNCARPGKVLSRMTDTTTDAAFIDLLSRRRTRWPWDAVLLSGGGNDLIAAAMVPGDAPPALRLLLRADEWGADPGPERYLSAEGWNTFESHLLEVFDLVVAQRDQGVHPETPIVLHTYDRMTPRDAPAGPFLGPWLFKAMNNLYGIPPLDWSGLADLLIVKLSQTLQECALRHPNVKLVNTVGQLVRAERDTTGVSNDWENEIHPTAHGYAVLAQVWRPVLDQLPRLDLV